MDFSSLFMLALCMYREARGEGTTGMNAVGCVIRNRTIKNKSSYYSEIIKPWQFSSITDPNDKQLSKFPKDSDLSWSDAKYAAQYIFDGSVADITNGATLYYDDSIQFPKSWNRDKVIFTAKIGRLNFFREI